MLSSVKLQNFVPEQVWDTYREWPPELGSTCSLLTDLSYDDRGGMRS